MPTDLIEFNDDELNAPKWMNSEFFTQVIQHCESDTLAHVTSFVTSPASAKGDHYASIMFRVKVDYIAHGATKSRSLIIKTMPELEGQKKDLLRDSFIFETEIGMYAEVIPRIQKTLKEIGDNTVIAPKCVYYSLSPVKLIVFDDLVVEGYSVLRDREITYEELKCAYAKLAKWQAIAYKILQEEPDYFKEYYHGSMELKEWQENPFFKSGIENFAEFLTTEPSLSQYAKYFVNSHEQIRLKCIQSCNSFRQNRNPNLYYTLCHGDFHMKNIMLKYNKQTGAFQDLLLLDLQICNIAPLQNDLAYAKYMMMGPDLRQHKSDEAVFYYHEVFTETLDKIGFKGHKPTLVELRQQMLEDKYFELYLMTSFLPLSLKFQEGDIDIDLAFSSREYQKSFYRNPKYIEEMQRLLPKYLHEGFFEGLDKM